MDYTEVPAGNYTGTAVKATAGQASTGAPYIEVEFRIPEVGCNLRWRGYVNSPENEERTLKQMNIINWNGDETFTAGSISTDKLCSLTVKREEFKGKTTPKIAWINDPDQVRPGFGTGDGSALKGLGLKAKMQKMREKEAKNAPSFDADEEIMF